MSDLRKWHYNSHIALGLVSKLVAECVKHFEWKRIDDDLVDFRYESTF
jgi:hypothetical protein